MEVCCWWCVEEWLSEHWPSRRAFTSDPKEFARGQQTEIALVLLALTKQGLSEMLNLVRGNDFAIWVNHGLLDDANLDQLRAEGFDLTNFIL